MDDFAFPDPYEFIDEQYLIGCDYLDELADADEEDFDEHIRLDQETAYAERENRL